MDLEKLEEYIGTEQSYIKLCGILDEIPKKANSKIKQIKQWKAYFDFEKNKSKYKIIEIYDEPMGLKCRSDFITALEIAIPKIIERKGTNVFSYNDLFKELRMVSDLYIQVSFEPFKFLHLLDEIKMPDQLFDDTWERDKEEDLYRFLQMSKKLMKDKLNSAFKSMGERGIFKVEKVHKYGRQGKHFESRECDGIENAMIAELRKQKLIDLFGDNDNNEVRLFKSKQVVRNKFNKEMNELTAMQSDYEFVFKCVKLDKNKNIPVTVQHLNFNEDMTNKLLNSTQLNKVVYIPTLKDFLVNKLIKR